MAIFSRNKRARRGFESLQARSLLARENRRPGKVWEVDPLVCPRCGGGMKVVAFLTEPVVVDRIIRHLELAFMAEKPPPAYAFEQVSLMTAEGSKDYE